MDAVTGMGRAESAEAGDVKGRASVDRVALLSRLEERRDKLRAAAQIPSKLDESLIRVARYTRTYPWPMLAGALLAGMLLGRLARRRGFALLLPIALPVLRHQVLPRVVNRVVSSARRSEGVH